MLLSITGKAGLLALLANSCVAEFLWSITEKATAGALKYQPVLDFDKTACYHSAAINAAGQTNKGYEPGEGDCRTLSRLVFTNTYVTQKCPDDGWCAYLYGYYFEKDEGIAGTKGHRHDWEHIMVWTLNGEAKSVAWSGHGDYSVIGAGSSSVKWEGNHPKFVVHRDGSTIFGSTHAFRLARSGDEPPENEQHKWIRGSLLSLEMMDQKLKDGLLNNNWGSAHADLSEGRFKSAYWATWNLMQGKLPERPDNPRPRPPMR